MLAWLKSPRGAAAIATAIVVVAASFWLVPSLTQIGNRIPASRTGVQSASVPAPAEPASPGAASVKPQGSSATVPPSDAKASATQPSATPPSDARPQRTAAVPPASAAGNPASPQAAASPTSTAPPSTAAPATTPPSAAAVPSFDIVRVEPSGDSVIAGRGAPDADVALVDGDKILARVKADHSGQFALLPPKLAEGSHYLTLRTQQAGQAPVTSTQGVAVSVAKGRATEPLVALMTPDQPARVLSDGFQPEAPKAAAPAAAAPNATALPVAIQAVEAAPGGRLMASGVARAGSQCRLYLNGAFLADVRAGKDGRWSVKVQKGMRPGKYTVRADELAPAGGAVVNRAEVPFDYPETAVAGRARQKLLARGSVGAVPPPVSPGAVAAGSAPSQPVATGGEEAAAAHPQAPKQTASAATSSSADELSPASAVVDDLQTAKVIRGDSLWRISRKMLGHGVNYTEIYASNESQIRDPSLIYPGQIFVIPHRAID